MGRAIQTVGGQATTTNVAGAVHPAVPSTGESFIPGSFPRGSMARLEQVFTDFSAANTLRFRGPSLHDNEQALHWKAPVGDPTPLMPSFGEEPLVPQENIIVEMVEDTAVIAAAQVFAATYYYEDLDGASADFYNPGDIDPLIKHMLTVRVPVVVNAAAGIWKSVAINSLEDSLHSESQYAVVGYTADLQVCAIAVHGPDTSNYRVGGPGSTDRAKTRAWFWEESIRHETPHIPVLDPKNRGSTYVDVIARAVAGTVNVELILAEIPGTPS